MKKHGKGSIFFKKGGKFIGSFVQGRIEGMGVYHANDEKKI